MAEIEPDWTPAQRAVLDTLARPEPSLAELEERVVAVLSGEGRLRARHARNTAVAWARGMATTVLIAAAFVGGRRCGAGSGGGSGQPRFVLLLYADAASLGAEQERERTEEYRRWATGLRQAGHLVSGEKLSQARLMLGPLPPAPEPGRVVAGFFVIDAESFEEATRLARGCPHLKHGGRVELRRIDPT